MAASSRLMITEAERQFPTRIKIAVPPEGLGRQLDLMNAWLDANCGAGNWAMTPTGLRGIVNDALAIYFLDTALASAFVARWCIGYANRGLMRGHVAVPIRLEDGTLAGYIGVTEAKLPPRWHGIPSRVAVPLRKPA